MTTLTPMTTMTPPMTTLTTLTTTFKARLKKAGAVEAAAPVDAGVGIASACQEHAWLRCKFLLLLRFYLEIQDKSDLNLTPSFAVAIVIPTGDTHTHRHTSHGFAQQSQQLNIFLSTKHWQSLSSQ